MDDIGIPVLILGESGSGKSTSMRNFEKNELAVFNVASKPFPFRKKLPKLDGAKYADIKGNIGQGKYKIYVVDDSQYLMAFSMFERARETGYGKFTDTAVDFYNLIQFIIKETPKDTIVYFLHHTDVSDSGKIKAKTSGKMLDNQLTVEGLFSIVLLASTDGTKHVFQTQSDGYTTAKSPMEMFEKEVDNDLKVVDTIIRDYWGLTQIRNNEDKGVEVDESIQ